MKQLLTIFVLLCVLSACKSRQMKDELHRVDSLNQNDVSLDTITTMQDVVEYFDTWGSNDEKMISHYLLGRVFQDQHDIPRALRCFREAASFADTTDEDCNYLRLSRVYGQMAELFNQQRAPRLELEAENNAVKYAWKAKDTLNAIIFYSYLDGAYHMLNEMDSALYYNQSAVQMLKDYGYHEYAAGILPMSIDIYLRKKDYQRAKLIMDEFEKSITIQDKDMLYGYKGLYYEGMGRLDSAEYNYRQLLQNNINNSQIETAYKGLLSIYHQKGIIDSVTKYANLYCETNDSASFSHSADAITRAQALYNYEESERIAEQKTKEADEYRRMIIYTIIIISIVTIITYRFIRRQERRKRESLMAANVEYTSLLMQYQQVQKDLDLSKQDSNKFRETKEMEIKALQQQLSIYQETPQITEHWNIEQAMLDNPLVLNLHQMAASAKKPSQIQWRDFREFFEREHPDFYYHINNKDVMLSPQEVITCILIRLQFSQGEIAALFSVSKQRVNNIKSSINKKLFQETGASTLDNNIMTL